MRPARCLPLLLLGTMTAVPWAGAHSQFYVNLTGDVLLDVNPDGLLFQPGTCIDLVDLGFVDRLSQGGVCYPGGHVVPDAAGHATLTVTDVAISPASGYYCQDLNANSVCGENETPCPDVPGVEFESRPFWFWQCNRQEPAVLFCSSVVLDSPIHLAPRSPAAWAAGENWDPGAAIYVFIDGPISGNFVFSPCQTLYSGGTEGQVNHT